MKNIKIKIVTSSLLLIITLVIFNSCVKSREGRTDFSSISPIVLIPEGGLANFGTSALNENPNSATDSARFHVNFASKDIVQKDITVTLAVDPTAVATYNSNPGNTTKYDLFPDSIYSFTSKTVVIKAGQNYADVLLNLFPSKIDFGKNYMLPITIKDAQGATISGNFGTIYFHLIGNPLAGVYNVVGTRYNYVGSAGYSGGPIPTNYASTATSPSPKTGAAVDPTTIALDFANLGGNGYQYLINYDPTNPNVVNVSGNFLSAVSNFKVYTQTYDPVLKQIHITSSYTNGAGNDRIIDEVFTHQ